jgi:branched-chain amino acid aminotransferase
MTAHERTIWVDGERVPWGEATVHVLSQSMQRGTLVFDYMSVHDTDRGPAIFRPAEHLERFRRSCELVGLPLAHDLAELRAATRESVAANPGCHSIKICAYLPSIEVELVPQDDHVSVAIAAYDLREDIIEVNRGTFHWRDQVRLWIEKEKRNRREDVLPPQAKVAANYAPTLVAKWRARRRGYDEILLLSEDGSLAETPTTNLFVVTAEGVLRTPRSERVLHGVTRSSIFDIAAAEGLDCAEATLYPDDLLAASEAFLTATSAGVWPVVSVDDTELGSGDPGPVSLRLRDRLRRIWSGQDAHFEHWLDYVSSQP